MTKGEFLNKVTEIKQREGCSVSDAIERAGEEFKMTVDQVQALFKD